MSLDEYPGVSPFTDRHGKQRWRYRAPGRGGKQTNLPGNPGDPAFQTAYENAVAGIKPTTAQVKRLPAPAFRPERAGSIA